MLNEFESCSSRLFQLKSTHSPCSACCRKRVGWIRCKCNQNLERNKSARRVGSSAIDIRLLEALRRTAMHTVYTGLVWACVRMNWNV